jgi:abortive infection bacteriophage resistance protein
MKYTKPSLSFEQQADLLISRGLQADRSTLISRLSDVNYYRLSAYWYTFRNPNDPGDRLLPDTNFDTIWNRYVFDRHLRLLVMDAIERVEISIRTRMTELFTRQHGAFGYLRSSSFGNSFDIEEHDRLVSEIRRNTHHSREEFVRHFQNKYSDEKDLPLWMAVEVMTFGNLLTMFRHLTMHDKRTIASAYSLSAKVLESWLVTINYIRNLCAHHARLWNRELAIKPLIPFQKNDPAWHSPVSIPNDRMFAILSLLNYLMQKIAPQSRWRNRLEALLQQYSQDIPLRQMGFIGSWQQHALWKQNAEARQQ